MKTYQVNLINPKAFKLLQELAALKLIELKETKQQDFLSIVSQMRKKASSSVPSLEEISMRIKFTTTENEY